MEVTRRRGGRRKKLLDDLKDRRGYCHLKEEALDRTMWRNRFRGGFGPVVRQNIGWMNEWMKCKDVVLSVKSWQSSYKHTGTTADLARHGNGKSPYILDDVAFATRWIAWFVHDDPPHCIGDIKHFLDYQYRYRWIGRSWLVFWPSRSPALTPADVHLCGGHLTFRNRASYI